MMNDIEGIYAAYDILRAIYLHCIEFYQMHKR